MPEETLTPHSLGFRPMAHFGQRKALVAPGRMIVEGEAGERICYILNEGEDATALHASTAPATYMWIVTGEQRPVYVGKAGHGMAARMRQHEDGFHGTAAERVKRNECQERGEVRDITPGFGHARRIRELWDGGKILELWARRADVVTVFGGEVALEATEETRLIALFQPPWNREHKRD